MVTNVEEVQKGVETIFQEGQVIEVRAFGEDTPPKIIRFTERDKAVKTIVALSDGGKYHGVYYTLNEIPEQVKGNAAADSDVIRRNWLFIDCDTVRPKDVSSTEEEKSASFDVAKNIVSEMMSRGWPAPVVADSGNGAHLLYKINTENTTDAALLVRNTLAALNKKFSTSQVIIDGVVFNAARITKAYGSIVRKGIATEERPHRASKILVTGTGLLLSEGLMSAFVEEIGIVPKPAEMIAEGIVEINDAVQLTPEKMEEFLNHCDVNYHPAEDILQNNEEGVRFILENCPWTEEHSGTDAKKDAAVFVMNDGGFGFHCFHSHCQERGWKEFRVKVQEGKKKFTFIDTGSVVVGGKNKQEQITNHSPTVSMRTMSDVKAEPLHWLWPNRIPRGAMVLFGGDPSQGKSLMSLDLASRLSIGDDFIDGEKNELPPCESIFLSCEDDANKILKPRFMMAGADCDKIHLIDSVTDNTGERMFRLDKDIPRLKQILYEHPNVRLLVVDPINNYTGVADTNRDVEMRRMLTPLSMVAKDHDISIVIIMHNNKSKNVTGLQKIGGALGAAGVYRMGWTFMRSEDENCQIMIQIKENYGKFPGIQFTTVGFDMKIGDETVNVPRMEYIGETDKSANQLLAEQSGGGNIGVSGKNKKEKTDTLPVHKITKVNE